jgi:hypothetical protein
LITGGPCPTHPATRNLVAEHYATNAAIAAKAHFSGAHRVREPAQTWDLVSPLMGDYGVTRVADVTGLDVIGIPVWMAVRPLAATLAVSQGKGATESRPSQATSRSSST